MHLRPVVARVSSRLGFALTLAAFLWSAMAAPPALATAITPSFTGTLKDQDGALITATCQVEALSGGYIAGSGWSSGGTYTVANLTQGTTYTIYATGCVNWPDAYEAAAYGTNLIATSGLTTGVDIVMQKTTPASFSVTILSPFDTPYPSCPVYLIDPFDNSAGTVVNTNGSGVASFLRAPGSYVLYTGSAALCGASTWYDGKSSTATADQIALTAGTNTPLTWHPVSRDMTKLAVTGTLKDDHGANLNACLVEALDPDGVLVASTWSSNGVFAFGTLDPSITYTIRGKGCVNWPDAYEPAVWPSDVSGVAGDLVTGVDLVLTKTTAAQLTLTMTSPYGQPMGTCFAGVIDPADNMLDQYQMNGLGQHTWYLAPGSYALYTPGTGCGGSTPVWYDGKASLATADLVTLTAGGTTTMSWTPYGQDPTKLAITGHLHDQDAASVTIACQVDALDPDTGAIVASVWASNGFYAFGSLDPAGSYRIRARGCINLTDAYEPAEYGSPVSGAAGDVVTGIDLVLQKTTTAVVTITVKGIDESLLAGCSVSVIDPVLNAEVQHQSSNANGQTTWYLVPGDWDLYTDGTGCGGGATWYQAKGSFATADQVSFVSGSQGFTWYPYAAPADTAAPDISCDAPPTGWQAGDVTIHCTASDAGSGLANSADASFDLTTSVADGTVDGNASTDSRHVCDALDNCADAGPVTGLQVDRQAPTASVVGIADGATVIVGASPAVSASCDDGSGSGVASCAVTTALDTSSVGVKAITVTAVDNVGHQAQATIHVTVRYGTCGLNAKTSQGQTTVTFKVCNAAGVNLSSASLAVSAVGLVGPSGPVTLVAANGGVFTYVAKSKSYQLVVTTSGLPKGSYSLGIHIGADPVAYSLGFKLR